jgi:SAM-dependent methyltransferase
MSVTTALKRWLGRHPVLKATLRAVLAPVRGGESTGYHRLDKSQSSAASAQLRAAWQAESMPQRQRRGVDEQLAAFRRGDETPVFDALVRMLRPLVDSFEPDVRISLLEVGCSSGYHAEVLAERQLRVSYQGCDYSPAFVRMAHEYYPNLPFSVADATALPMPSDSVDIVLSGCCLLHIPEYEQAIRESARVARRYVVFHRTPVLHNAPTTYFRKRAYDVETIEIHFNEEELVGLFARCGLRVIGLATLNVSWKSGAMYATKGYVCEKCATSSGALGGA